MRQYGLLELTIALQKSNSMATSWNPNKSAFKHNMKLICLYTEHNLDLSECLDWNSMIYAGCQARVYQKYCIGIIGLLEIPMRYL